MIILYTQLNIHQFHSTSVILDSINVQFCTCGIRNDEKEDDDLEAGLTSRFHPLPNPLSPPPEGRR
jgi:hypothetical protein